MIPAPQTTLPPDATSSFDETDRRLIELLIENGRATVAELALAVGLSGDAVGERVRRLIDGGVVTIVGSVSPETVGLTVTALVGMRVAGPVVPIARILAALPFIDFVVATAGSFDLLVEVVAPSHADVADLFDEHVRIHTEIVAIEVFLYLSVEKWTNAPSAAQRGLSPRELDSDERLIINALRADGRLTYRALAVQTGISYPTARRKAIALMESGVVQIATVVNRTATGERVSAAIGVCVNGSPEATIRALREIDEISVIATCAGRFDLLLDVATSSTESMRDLVFDTIRNCPGIRSTETFYYLKILQLPFSWVLPESTP